MEDRLEFFKELYYKELESKELLANRFTTNLTIVTFLIGGLLFCIKNVNDLESSKIYFIFLIFALLSSLIDVAIIVLLLNHIRGKEYAFLPSPQKLQERYKELELHYQSYPSVTQDDIENAFKKDLYEYYVEIGNHNFIVNDTRIKLLNTVNPLIIVSVITTALTLSCFVPNFFKDDSNVQKVEIIQEEKSTFSQQVNKSSVKEPGKVIQDGK